MDGLPKLHLEAFLADRCNMAPNVLERSATLGEAYKRWCVNFGLAPMTKKMFGATLSQAGFSSARTATYRGWIGLALKAVT
jgi:hypothetical protein